MRIRHDLDLDMAWRGHQRFDVDIATAECGGRFRYAAHVGLGNRQRVVHRAHAASAAAGHRFDHHAVRGRQRSEEGLCIFQRRRTARAVDDGDAGFMGKRTSTGLVAEEVEHVRCRPDELHASLCALARERGVLAQEAVAGVDGIGAHGACGGKDGVTVEIGAWAGAGQGHGFISA